MRRCILPKGSSAARWRQACARFYSTKDVEEGAKRPRGRPRKISDSQSGAEIDGTKTLVGKNALPAANGVEPLTGNAELEVPVRKPKGRPRKVVDGQSSAERSAPNPKGRPRKVAEEQMVPAAAEKEPVVFEAAPPILFGVDMPVAQRKKAASNVPQESRPRSKEEIESLWGLRREDLPVSPLMDPAFLAAREKHRLPKPPPTRGDPGSLHARLAKNPYALALATPTRQCNITGTILPKFFLQDYNMMAHPVTGETWYVPSSLTGHEESPAEKRARKKASKASSEVVDGESIDDEDAIMDKVPANERGNGRKIGQNVYTLNSSLLLDEMEKSRFNVQRFIPQRIRHINVATRTAANARWRTDMGSFLTELWRRRISEDLVFLKNVPGNYYMKFKNFDAAKQSRQIGAFLWTGQGVEDEAAPAQWATIDVHRGYKGSGQTRKVPVYNLKEMLGDKALEKFTERQDGKAPILGAPIVGVRDKIVTLPLMMKLWKMRGFLAVPEPEIEVVYDIDDEEEEDEDDE